jgi:hypothetical protein
MCSIIIVTVKIVQEYMEERVFWMQDKSCITILRKLIKLESDVTIVYQQENRKGDVKLRQFLVSFIWFISSVLKVKGRMTRNTALASQTVMNTNRDTNG